MSPRPLAFVTGATGFVGSHLVQRLLDEGYAVHALVFEKEGSSFLDRLGVRCFPGDITGPLEPLRRALTGATHVFHLAAHVSDWTSRRTMLNVNVRGLRNLLDALRDLPVQRFVLLSSMVVYGDDDLVRADESRPFIETGDNYNHTKIACERVLWKYVRRTGLPAVALRPPYIYGPRDNHFVPRMCSALLRRKWMYIAGGRIPFNLVSVDNVVQACLLAAIRPEAVGRGFLITDGRTITRRQLIELLCDEMGYDRRCLSVPRCYARFATPFYEIAARVFHPDRPPYINRFLYQFGASHMDFDISAARRLLGFDPVSSTLDSLRATAAWLRENRPDLLPQAGTRTRHD